MVRLRDGFFRNLRPLFPYFLIPKFSIQPFPNACVVPDILFKNLFEVGFSRHINHCIQEELILDRKSVV